MCLAMAGIGLADAGADGSSGFDEDHLVVSRLPVAPNAQAVTLERLNGVGVSDGPAWPLPTSDSGSNHRFTLEGDSSAVGALARSADGRFVTLAGYTQPLGTVLGNSSDTAPRVVARVDSVGNVDTSTTLSTNFTQEKIRGAVTDDGSAFWVTGHGNTASPKGGMVYAPLGSSKPTVLFTKDSVSPSNSALNNTRTVQIAGGNLYFGSEKGTAGIFRTTGLPTSAQAPTSVASFGADGSGPISLLPLKHEAAASSIDTMYVVRETVGIFKFSFNGSTWANQGEVIGGSYTGVTGKVDSDGHFRLYAIQGGGAENAIVAMTDTAPFNAPPSVTTPTVVSTAPPGTAYRGIAFAPHDPTLAVPGAPTGVSATAGDSKASLTWAEPGEAGGSPISAYTITPFIAGVAQSPINTPTAATSYTVEGLANGTAYTFAVAAVNANGTGPASSPSAPVTPQAPGAPTPTIELSDTALEGSVGDPTNPTVDVTVAQAGTEASELDVEATGSTNAAVAAASGVNVAGAGATRAVSVTPAGGVGYADITLRVTGLEGKTATTVLHYAASAATSTPSTSRFHTGAADASTAIDVGDGYMLLGDDENNTLRLYRSDTSGPPVKTWNFGAQMGSPEEIDIEAAVRSGNTIYWTGSMGNSKKGNLKPDRSVLFTTQVSGSGAGTELTFGGYYRGLRNDLIAWDEENADRFGFAAGAASGNVPKQIDGFNVEGLEFAPGGSGAAYVGFRAPLSPATADGDAIVVPVTNFDQLATSGQNTSVHASFGAPILMDFDGLSIREIRKNADDEYLILAGSWAAGGEYALFTWDGSAADAPVRALTSLPADDVSGEDPGAWESIVGVPDPIASGDDLQLVMDNGSTDFYGDGQEAKELIPELQKSRSDHFSLELTEAPGNTAPPLASGSSPFGSQLSCSPGAWSAVPASSFTYRWQRDGADIAGAASTTYVTKAADVGKAIRCSVTATNSVGSASASSNEITVTTAPTCTGSDIVGAGTLTQEAVQYNVWMPGFSSETCPGGPTVQYFGAEGSAAMENWRYHDGDPGSFNTGLKFIGTDEAPTSAQLANIESAAKGADVVVIPVAQTAIAIPANPPAGCAVGKITNTDLERVFRGVLTEWSQLATAEGACESPITRVVRKDNSGTTYQLKNYLFKLNPTPLPCTAGASAGKATWQELAPNNEVASGEPNTSWAETCRGRKLSAVVKPGSPGDDRVIETVDATAGSIGYVALPNAKEVSGDFTILSLQSNGWKPAAEATFADPANGGLANCAATKYAVPADGQQTSGAGLNVDWSQVSGGQPGIGGTSYPLCMLTYDLALHGYGTAGYKFKDYKTARDYLREYIVFAGQSALASAGQYYSPLPTSGAAQSNVLGAARFAAGKIGY